MLLVFVPVLGLYLAHAPVLRHDLFPRLDRPLDRGATFRGRRVFGDNKTWRGAIVMGGGVFVAAIALSAWPAYWDALPDGIRSAGPVPFGALLALGVVVGELPNSFVKRQLGIGPGAHRRSAAGIVVAIVDQGDLVLGAWICLLPIWVMSVAQAALAFVVVTGVHMAINVIGFWIGARRSPL